MEQNNNHNHKSLVPVLKRQWRWDLMPASIIIIGAFSIILLLWVIRLNLKLQDDAELVDAVMDVQIHIAIGHLLAEEAFRGDIVTAADVKETLPHIDQAISLLDAVLIGGIVEHGFVSERLTDPELSAKAEKIRALLTEFRDLTARHLRDPYGYKASHAFQIEFHGLFKEIVTTARALEDAIEVTEAAHREKSRHLVRVVLAVWAFIVILATAGLLNRERYRRKAEEALVGANRQLLSQAEELTEHREHLSELVDRRTAELTAANEALKEAEKQCRSLSSELLDAQEVERRRISMELHDELGQALSAMKLQTRVIETKLKEDQGPIKEDCDKMMDYMDQVIEDVRRLSLNLSPVVLEDIGLTSALRWLGNNLADTEGVKVKLDTEDIDGLLPKRQWITVYRVIQEALTNIGRHAQAENVSLAVRRDNDMVFFSVEDDGQGFDMKEASAKEILDRGLGLTTMSERARMMGGVFNLRSRKGEGTRITVRIPIEKG